MPSKAEAFLTSRVQLLNEGILFRIHNHNDIIEGSHSQLPLLLSIPIHAPDARREFKACFD